MTKWVTKKLGDLVVPTKGRLTSQSDYYVEDWLPLINTTAIDGEPNLWADPTNGILCNTNDVLMLWDGERSGLVITNKEGVVGSTFARFRPQKEIDGKYIYYYLSNRFDWIQNRRTGTGVPHAPKDLMRILDITYPESLTEQRRIAGILSSADGAIAASEALIAKYRNIKRGLLATLLRPKEGWKKVKLGEVGKVVTGLTYSPNNVVDEGVLVLRSSNIQNDNISLEDNVYVNVTEYNPVQEGDVLICVRNGSRALIGKTARINKEVDGCAFGAFMAIYRSEYNGLLYHFFKSDSFFSQVSKNIGATINSINGSDLKDMEVYLPYKNGQPDLAEQRRIAEILSSVDAKIAAEEKVVEKYKGVKKGLMESMMNTNYQCK